MSQDLISKMNTDFGNEVIELSTTLEKRIDDLRTRGVEIYPNIRIADDGKTAGTINVDDFAILHMLVRTFKPRVVFEVGTWLGTSAMVIADGMRMNGSGHVYTCDQNSYYALDKAYDDIITRLVGFSDTVVKDIPDASKVDMIFADGELTFGTLKALGPYMKDKTIIVTHDYEGIAEKGVTNLIRSQVVKHGAYEMILNPKINSDSDETTIAILLPPSIVSSFELQKTNSLRKYMYLIYLSVRTYSFLILRKLFRIINQFFNHYDQSNN